MSCNHYSVTDKLATHHSSISIIVQTRFSSAITDSDCICISSGEAEQIFLELIVKIEVKVKNKE